MRRSASDAALLLLLAIPAAVIVTFWGNGGWSQQSTPVWWWILASVCATLGIATWWARRREKSTDTGHQPDEDVPAALAAWWLFGQALLYLFWLGLAVAFVVAGSAVGRVIGACLLFACFLIAARVVHRRASREA